MSELTAEQLAQRIYDCRLLESKQIDRTFSELGGRGASFDAYSRRLLQNELLTNWQLQRVVDGHRRGYYYGNWKVLYIVGTGTFARVYRCAHKNTHDVKAVKVLRNRYSDDHETRDRFLREARTVMKLRHPNIVPIHEIGEERGRNYMVMDFIEGQNLRDYVKAHRKLKLLVALDIVRDVLCGLDYAFHQGVCHRDIKMSNVLLSSTGRASLVDFGLAAANQGEDGSSKIFHPRSVDYAGLERTTNVPRNDSRSDIFFVGCVLYHLLAGESPLTETRERMARMNPARFRNIQPLSSLVDDIPHRVVVLINRMMELKTEARIQTPGQALLEITATIDAIKSGDNAKIRRTAAGIGGGGVFVRRSARLQRATGRR